MGLFLVSSYQSFGNNSRFFFNAPFRFHTLSRALAHSGSPVSSHMLTMDQKDTAERKYKSTDLPTVSDYQGNRDLLFKLYEETSANWRQLTEVRFHLLALVPAVSILLVATVLSEEGPAKGLSVLGKVAIAAFGLMVTLGLLIYDLRNSQFYDDLISRGRKIEEELGVHTAIFAGRLKPKPSCPWIKHGLATSIIYGSSLVAWIGAAAMIITTSQIGPKAAIEKTLDFMPSFYEQTSPKWKLQSIVLDSNGKNYEIRLYEDTTKAQFSVTVPITGNITKVQKLP
jgi:hypothetical protein